MDNQKLLDAISEMMDEKLDALDKRLDMVDKRLDMTEERLDMADGRLKAVNSGQEKAESCVSAIRRTMAEMRRELKAVSDRGSNTYQLALDAWGQSTENRKMLDRFH